MSLEVLCIFAVIHTSVQLFSFPPQKLQKVYYEKIFLFYLKCEALRLKLKRVSAREKQFYSERSILERKINT